jgi:uncharacterized membrane protein
MAWATLACVAALLAVRVPFLFEPAVWIDEAFSIYHARHSLSVLWGLGWQLESSPPLYYSAIWAWTHLFGQAEPVARSLSLALTAVAALCLYGAGAWAGGRRAGAAAAILFLCQPLMFVYSIEIRPYALEVLLIAAAVAALAKALSDLEEGRLRSAPTVLRRVAPIVAAAALAAYAHSTTPAFLLALSGAVAVYGAVRRARRGFWLVWFLANAAALLAIAPELLVMLEVIRTNEKGIAWIPAPYLWWIASVLRSLTVGEHSWSTVLVKFVGACVVGLIAWSGWRLRRRPVALTVGLVLPVLGFASLWAVSMLQPILMPRTALWLVVPLCVLAGAGLATVRWRGFGFWAPAVVIVLAFVLASVTNVNGRTRDRPWSGFFRQLAEEMQPADEVVAVDPEVLCVLDYYATTDAQRNGTKWRLERGPAQAYRSRQRIPLGCNEVPALSVEDLSTRLDQGTVFWLLSGQRVDVEAALQALGTSVSVTRRYAWRDKTFVWRITRR